MRVACCIVAAGVLISAASGAEKPREWQTGTVLDSQRASIYHGVIDTGNAVTPVYAEYANFAIAGQTRTYYAQERIRVLKFNKPANLTINAPVKFAVEKRWLYVMDNEGKEHRMSITREMATQRQPIVQPAPTLTNSDILKLKAAGLSDALVVEKIEASSGNGYRLAVDDLLSLKQQGLSDAVVGAMIRAAQGK